MKIGIFSDTHDHLEKISKAVSFFNERDCEIVLHAGDIVAPFSVRAMHGLKAKIIAVFGNNDGEIKGLEGAFRPQDEIHHPPYSFMLEGKHFLLSHDPANLKNIKSKENFNFIVYGHVHEKFYQAGPPVIINPGECCGWLTGVSSVVLLDSVSGEVTFHDL
jgi:hypothetical protein